MKRKKKAALLLALLLSFSALLYGCREKESTDTGYYERDVLSGLTRPEAEGEKLTGMTEDLCVIRDEGIYDKALIDAGAAGLFSEDEKEVLYAKNALKKMYPASLTKCMTALLVLEPGIPFTKEVTVGDEVTDFTDASSLAGLKPGYTYSVEELLIALMVPSGNDAANALAVLVAGSVKDFVARMNERAKELGMLNTHFVSPHGLHDSTHYTTVYDLYLLTRECINYTDFLRIASLSEASIGGTAPGGGTDVQSYRSTNSYLRTYTIPPEGLTVRASKTGYTSKAGRCLILFVTDASGKRYISIILNAETYDGLYVQMNALLSVIGQGKEQ